MLSLDGKHGCESDSDCLAGRICEAHMCVRDTHGEDAEAPDGEGAGENARDGGESSFPDGADGALDIDGEIPPEDAESETDAPESDPGDGAAADAAADTGVEPPRVEDFCGGPAPSMQTLLTPGTDSGRLRMAGDRLIAVGDPWSAGGQSWTLWEPSTARQIASGRAELNSRSYSPGSAAELVGDKFLTSRDDSVVEVRAAADGHVLGTVAATQIVYAGSSEGFLPRLSSDASYVWQQTSASLRAWSVDGQLLLNRAGNYAKAAIFAAPNELRVANGPAGTNVFERVALDGTATNSAPFLGSFVRWFDDGGRLLAMDGPVLRVYSLAAAVEQALQGQLDSWGHGDLLAVGGKIYRVGQAQPIAEFDLTDLFSLPERNTLWQPTGVRVYRNSLLNDRSPLTLLDLHGAQPSLHSYDLGGRTYSFASNEAGAWAAPMGGRVFFSPSVASAPTRQLGCGPVSALAGSRSGRVAIATSGDGLIRLFSLAGTQPVYEGAFQAAARALTMSSDGSALLTVTDDELHVYALPVGSVLYQPPFSSYASTNDGRGWYSLARDTERVAFGVCNTDGSNARSCEAHVTDFQGQRVIPAPIAFGDANSSSAPPHLPRLALSPSGTSLAHANGSSATSIYTNGAFSGGSAAPLLGWLDDSTLLLQRVTQTSGGGVTPTTEAIVTNLAGEPQRTLPAPSYILFHPIDATQFYDGASDSVLSTQDGHVVWHGDQPDLRDGLAVVAGDYRIAAGPDVWPAKWR